jgi:hypothetical protein
MTDTIEATDASTPPDDAKVARRRFLRRGAITAAVAASGAAVLARPAGAADGSPVNIGQANSGSGSGSATQLSASHLIVTNTVDNVVSIESVSNLGAQLKLTPNNLDLLTNSPADTHVFNAGSLVTDSNDILWLSLANGASAADGGLHPISLTAAFLPFAKPVRVIDTRSNGGPINGNTGQERTIHIFAANAPVVAMLSNLTVVDTTGSGYLAMFAADVAWDPANPFSSMNWFTTNQITANCVASAIDNSTGNIKVRAGGTGTTNFIIDITGVWVL